MFLCWFDSTFFLLQWLTYKRADIRATLKDWKLFMKIKMIAGKCIKIGWLKVRGSLVSAAQTPEWDFILNLIVTLRMHSGTTRAIQAAAMSLIYPILPNWGPAFDTVFLGMGKRSLHTVSVKLPHNDHLVLIINFKHSGNWWCCVCILHRCAWSGFL